MDGLDQHCFAISQKMLLFAVLLAHLQKSFVQHETHNNIK